MAEDERIPNPYRREGEAMSDEYPPNPSDEYSPNPFRRKRLDRPEDSKGGNPVREEKSQKIRDMGRALFPDPSLLQQVNPQVLELTQQDLEDLAVEMAGLDSHNPTVKGLTAEDIQDIQAIFLEPSIQAMQILRSQRGGGGDLASVEDIEARLSDEDLCCCCSTPCCCCAATEVDPFEVGTRAGA